MADLNLSQIAKEFSLPLTTLEGKLSSKGKLKIDNGQPDEYIPEVIDGDLWLSDKYNKDYSEFKRARNW